MLTLHYKVRIMFVGYITDAVYLDKLLKKDYLVFETDAGFMPLPKQC